VILDIFRLGAVALTLVHLSTMFTAVLTGVPMALVSLVVLATGVLLMGPGVKKATILFLAAGTGILLVSAQPFSVWVSSLNSMTNTVVIMVAMQIFTVPVTVGRFDKAIEAWANGRIKTTRALFGFSTLVTHVLTSILMFGAIPLSMALLRATLSSRVGDERRFTSVVISRGYVLSSLWAPGAINLYLVVIATGVPWSSLLLPGLVLSALGLGLSFWVESWPGGVLSGAAAADASSLTGRAGAAGTRSAMPGGQVGGVSGIGQVIAAAISMVLIVLALEYLKIGSTYTRIMLSGLLTASAWIILLGKGKESAAALREYWVEGIPKVRDLGPFFVAMGVFSGALEASGLLDKAIPAIQAAANTLGIASIAIIPLAIVGLALIGFHPFITLVLFGKILTAAGMPLSNLTIALSLASGGAAAYMISPFAGIIMSLARYTGSKATEIAINWNWKYSLAFYMLGMVFALSWGFVFG